MSSTERFAALTATDCAAASPAAFAADLKVLLLLLRRSCSGRVRSYTRRAIRRAGRPNRTPLRVPVQHGERSNAAERINERPRRRRCDERRGTGSAPSKVKLGETREALTWPLAGWLARSLFAANLCAANNNSAGAATGCGHPKSAQPMMQLLLRGVVFFFKALYS